MDTEKAHREALPVFIRVDPWLLDVFWLVVKLLARADCFGHAIEATLL